MRGFARTADLLSGPPHDTPPPFYHAGGFYAPMKEGRGRKTFFKKRIDKSRKPAIIANVVARQSNMDAEMAELVEGARLEIV